jgi:hypothetical protein
MSNYSKFLDDLNEFYVDSKSKGINENISNDDALAAVRDQWIKQGKLTELISFIHTNWDSGNCDDFITPLEALLIETKQLEFFKLLWTKIIKYRLTALWASFDHLRRQTKNIDLREIISIDTSTFNMFSTDSYKDLKRVLAFRRQFVIDGLTKVRNGLLSLNQIDDLNRVSNFIIDISNLKRSAFKL